MNQRHARALLTVVIAIAVVIPASAQRPAPRCRVRLPMNRGRAPGATVTVVNVETGWSREAVTDTRGWYCAAALPPGRYEIRASLQGFVTWCVPASCSRSDRRPRSTSR